MDFNFRREGRLHLSDCPHMLCFLVVLLDFVTVGGAEHLYRCDIFGADRYLDVICRREKTKVKCFQDILLDILLIDSTEIVESFDLFEHFA